MVVQRLGARMPPCLQGLVLPSGNSKRWSCLANEAAPLLSTFLFKLKLNYKEDIIYNSAVLSEKLSCIVNKKRDSSGGPSGRGDQHHSLVFVDLTPSHAFS